MLISPPLAQIHAAIDQIHIGCSCELRTAPEPQLRITKGNLTIAIMEDGDPKGHFVLVRVRPSSDFLKDHLSAVDVMAQIVSLFSGPMN